MSTRKQIDSPQPQSCRCSLLRVSADASDDVLTYPSCRTLFIVSTLAAVWAILTLLRRKSTQRSTLFVAFVDLCFVGAFIAGVYELRGIAGADCSSFSDSGPTYLSVGTNGVSGSTGISANVKNECAMEKASFAFGIMNCIFFFITFLILLFMHRTKDEDNRRYETKVTRRRRSHDSRYAFDSGCELLSHASFIDSPVTGADTHAAADRHIAGARGIADAIMSKRRENILRGRNFKTQRGANGKRGTFTAGIALSFFFSFSKLFL